MGRVSYSECLRPGTLTSCLGSWGEHHYSAGTILFVNNTQITFFWFQGFCLKIKLQVHRDFVNIFLFRGFTSPKNMAEKEDRKAKGPKIPQNTPGNLRSGGNEDVRLKAAYTMNVEKICSNIDMV